MKPETLPTLKAYQKWRTHADENIPDDSPAYPANVTAALDDAIAELEKLEKVAQGEVVWRSKG